jgi:hypothetical protein
MREELRKGQAKCAVDFYAWQVPTQAQLPCGALYGTATSLRAGTAGDSLFPPSTALDHVESVPEATLTGVDIVLVPSLLDQVVRW